MHEKQCIIYGMNRQGKVMDKWSEYSAIKRMIEEYFNLKEEKKYEDFIKKLVMILGV